MIAVDTNVLVRYLARDDDAQLTQVLKLFRRKNSIFYIDDIVLIETNWVLRHSYQWTCVEVADAFSNLSRIENLVFENESRLLSSLRAVRAGADLADEIIVRKAREAAATMLATFDRELVKRHRPFAVEP